MNTRKCSGCGWLFPSSYKRRTCRFCGEFLEWAKQEIRERINAESRRFKAELAANQRAQSAAWIERIKALPFKPLTEEEWLAACKYFGKCAWCGTENIAGRRFFIEYQAGGRYTVWNVLPVCEKCCTAMRIQPDPFLRCTYAQGYYGTTTGENFKRILAYLQAKIEEAEND